MTSENYEKVQIEILITQREAMVAENKQREFEGHAMAYTEREFFSLENAFHELKRL
jgi:hypothetical protein